MKNYYFFIQFMLGKQLFYLPNPKSLEVDQVGYHYPSSGLTLWSVKINVWVSFQSDNIAVWTAKEINKSHKLFQQTKLFLYLNKIKKVCDRNFSSTKTLLLFHLIFLLEWNKISFSDIFFSKIKFPFSTTATTPSQNIS